MLDAESRGLKIRVSVVQFHPWPPFKSFGYNRFSLLVRFQSLVPNRCPLSSAAATAFVQPILTRDAKGLRRIIILRRWTRHLRLPGCLTGPLHPRLPST